MGIPSSVREEVLAELGWRFDSLRWEELSSSETSKRYAEFVKDSKIGLKIGKFMAKDRVRVWIKDGPAKEYRRGLEGVGYMADYIQRAYPGTAQILVAALGENWTLVEGSRDEKPMRCEATDGARRKYILWGPVSAIQGMYWKASLYRILHPGRVIAFVVTKPSLVPVPDEDWQLAKKLAELIGAECHQVTYAVTFKPPASEYKRTEVASHTN